MKKKYDNVNQTGKYAFISRWHRFVPAMFRGLWTVLAMALAFSALTAGANTLSAESEKRLNAAIASNQAEKRKLSKSARKIEDGLRQQIARSVGGKTANGNTVITAAEELCDCEIIAEVSDRLLLLVESAGGKIISKSVKYKSIHVLLPYHSIERLSEDADIKSIRRVVPRMLNKNDVSDGVVGHNVPQARETYGVSGAGVKVGVISDSARWLPEMQATGDLPSGVTILDGFDGETCDSNGNRTDTGEGSGMMEIVYDVAPDAKLFFATGFGTDPEFAEAIESFYANGCRVVVDDVGWPSDPAFQDGIVAQAINDFTAKGGVYFSSASNSGNKDSDTSGTWEGDFSDSGSTYGSYSGSKHSFSGSITANEITRTATGVALQWADSWDNPDSDYDLYVADADGKILASSCNGQGDDFANPPYEYVDIAKQIGSEFCGADNPGLYVVVVKCSGTGRFLRIDTVRGRLAISTDGSTSGHNAAAAAITCAAASAPYPKRAFLATDPIETYSSDGPRKVFFDKNGAAITEGNFLSSGGRTLQKPDVTAADDTFSYWCRLQFGTTTFTGTSAAAPHAAAIAALMLEANPSLDRDGVFNIMKSATFSGSSASWNRTSGYGILNAEECVRLAKASAIVEERTIDIPGDRTYGTCTLENDGSLWKTTAAFPEWVKSLAWVSDTGNMGSLTHNVWMGFSGTATLTVNCTTNDTGSPRYCDISITNKNTKSIQYVLHISQAPYLAPVVRPANDSYANATSLGNAASGNVSGSNVNATREIGEPYVYVSSSASQGTNTVWWAWTAPSAGVAVFDTAGSGFDTVMAAYAKASSVSTLGDKLDSNDDDKSQGSSYRQSKISFDTASGGAYRIAVAGYGTNSGSISLNWQFYVKVTFDGNGATSGSMSVATNAYNTATPLPSCGFEKTGHTFAGWATSASGPVLYQDGVSPIFNANTTLYAKWTPIVTIQVGKPVIIASGNADYVQLSWDSADNAAGYVVWRATSASGTKQRVQIPVGTENTISYTDGVGTYVQRCVAHDTTATPGVDYWYWIAATNGTALTFSDAVSDYRRVNLSLSKSKSSFDSDGGTDSPTVTANTSWTATKTKDWLTLTSASASGGGMLSFSVTANTDASPRSDTITVTAGGSTAHPVSAPFYVTQAAYVVPTVSVTFNANGGTGTMDAQTFQEGERKNLTSCAFTKSGFHFVGWADNPDATETEWTDGESFAPAEDIILYAVWRSNKHAVEFHANGGSGTMKAQTFTWNVAKEISACTFTREHYNFVGWATTEDGLLVYADQQQIQIDEDLDLWAVWEAKTYTITFNGNGATGGSMATQSFTYGMAQNLRANAFQKTGHDFKGWATTQGGAVVYADGALFSATGNITLWAVWEANTYTVTFNGNGATGGSMAAQSFTYGVAQNLRANAYQKTGHDFRGWATTQGGVVAYADGASFSATKDMMLYAVWEAKTYTITFNGNGATGGAMAAQSFTYGVAQNLRANAFQKTGHDFKGWATAQGGAVAYADGASFSATEDVTLYAVWEAKTYTITFNGNGATGGAMAAQSFTYGVAQNLRANAFQKTGHDFKGWATAQGGAVAYADGASFSATKDVTLYAAWEAKTYTIRFLANDGTGSVLGTQQFTYGVETRLETPSPVRDGYTLAGWSESANGGVAYVGDETIMFDNDVDLYAVWSAGLGGALAGTESLVWRTGGDAPWTGVALDGEDVARSGTVPDSANSWVATDVTGPGRLTFRWKVSSESYRDYQIDYLSFFVDGEEMDWIGGEVDWETRTFDLDEGTHTLKWTYFKDEVDFDGEDCAWLDNVFFLHRSGVSFAAPDATSGTLPDSIDGWENDEVALPDSGDLRCAKHEFSGWTDGTATYSPGDIYVLPSAAATLSAVWTAKIVATPEIVTPTHYISEMSSASIVCATPGATIRYALDGSDPLGANGIIYTSPFAVSGCPTILAAATLDDWFDSAVATATVSRVWTAAEVMNAPDRFFDLRADVPWTRDFAVSHDGVASLRSGAIGNDESTAFSTIVYGPGTASFWWKVASEIFKNRKIDYLSFQVDGTEAAWIGGEKDWTQCSANVSGDGAHTLSWIYSKDSEGSAGDDAGWVDEFVWTPTASAYVMVDAGDVGNVAIDRAWLEEKFPGVDPSASAAGLAANGKPVWQAYVAGYDPNNPNAGFRATIRIVNGLPVVEPDPDLGDSRTYVIEGKPTLKDDWSEPDSASRFFRIRVLPPEVSDGGGNASASLAAPIGVTATRDREDGVLVEWQAVSGATSYELWRGESGAPDPSSLVGTCAETSRLDPDAASGIQSRYWVRAIGPSVSSPLSAPAEGMTRLSAPQNVNAVSSGEPVVLSWDAVTGATSYEVWRAQTDDLSVAEKIGETSETSYSDSSLSRGVKYWYWVKPMHDEAVGSNSASTTGWRLLERPTSVTASQGTEAAGVRITWNAVDGAVSYNVLRSSNANDYATIGSTASTSFLDANPGISGTWYYVIEAVGRDVGSVGYSSYASGYQGVAAPSDVSATRGEDFSAVTVSWSAVDGANRYSIWRSISSSSSEATCISSYQTSYSYRDTTAYGGTNYYYWVKSYTNHGAVSDFSPRALGYNAEIASIVINGVSTLYGVGAQGCYGAMAKSQSGKVLPLPTSATWELVTTGYVNKVTIPSGFADADIISDNKSACFAVTNVPSNTLTLPSRQTINLGNKSTTIKASCTWHGVTKSATKVITMSPADSSSQYSSYIVGTNSAVVLGAYFGTATSVTVPTTFNGGTVKGLNGTFNNTAVASVTIPANVVAISANTFATGASLSTITVNSSNPNFSSTSGILFNKAKTMLMRYPPKKTGTSYVIPDSVTALSSSSLSGLSYLTSVYIPPRVTSFPAIGATSLSQIYFFGNRPGVNGGNIMTGIGTTSGTAYYLSGTTGWGDRFGAGWRSGTGIATAVWSNPLKSLAVGGSTSVASGGKATFTATATFQSGHSVTYTGSPITWSITSGSEYASISDSGVLTASAVTSAQTVIIKATAAMGGGTATATKTITITP
ncbi:MAG: InlB B-repeat-containing protein [Kiritimatiellae bacterium]|nr:InlB B-repeat-containing protein [Kiritimatiellia bacterium]